MSENATQKRRVEALEKRKKTRRTAKGSAGPLRLPNVIEFVTSSQFLDRPKLYPRQATLLKIMTLSVELLTDYDRQGIAQWESNFAVVERNGWTGYEGHLGLPPGTVERMVACRASGRVWFNEIVLVMGRRAGKGHLCALMICWVLWNLLAMDNPQEAFGIELTKQLVVMTMATEKNQAASTIHRDVIEMVRTVPCFDPYLGKPGTALRLWTPAQLAAGAEGEGSVLVAPLATTASSGRGSASVVFAFDEMAWAPADGQSRGADAAYRAAAASLTQFTNHGLVLAASSPASQTGEFYSCYQRALQLTGGEWTFPDSMVVQLPSWSPYEDWPLTREGLAMWPGGPDFAVLDRAIIAEDSRMVRNAREADHRSYLVEFEAQWRASQYSYFDADRVLAMFGEYQGRLLQQQFDGGANRVYAMACDPSVSEANFAVAIGHRDGDRETGHIVIDYCHAFVPAHYPDGRIDYPDVQDKVWALIERFRPWIVTFDQHNSEQMIQTLQNRVRDRGLSGRITIKDRPATATLNWIDAERFKTHLSQRRIHAPFHPLARDEFLFLEQRGSRIDHPTAGRVQTSDLVDCFLAVTAHLLDPGFDIANQMSSTTLTGAPWRGPHPAFNEFYSTRRGPEPYNPARPGDRRRY